MKLHATVRTMPRRLRRSVKATGVVGGDPAVEEWCGDVAQEVEGALGEGVADATVLFRQG